MPYLYQTDKRWAYRPYTEGGTIGDSGCGPTSLNMVYVYFTGDTAKDPADFCAWTELNGFIDTNLTSWLLMSEGAARWGLRSIELPADASAVTEQLQAGHPVICTVGPGDFTDKGHFLVLSSIDDAGQVWIHDPNSEQNSQKGWDLDRVLRQCRNLWAYDKA